MGRTKELLEEEWHLNTGRIELSWMEQEYFHYLSRPKKYFYYEIKLKDEEAIPREESERPYIHFTQKTDRRDVGYSRTKRRGIGTKSRDSSADK